MYSERKAKLPTHPTKLSPLFSSKWGRGGARFGSSSPTCPLFHFSAYAYMYPGGDRTKINALSMEEKYIIMGFHHVLQISYMHEISVSKLSYACFHYIKPKHKLLKENTLEIDIILTKITGMLVHNYIVNKQGLELKCMHYFVQCQ